MKTVTKEKKKRVSNFPRYGPDYIWNIFGIFFNLEHLVVCAIAFVICLVDYVISLLQKYWFYLQSTLLMMHVHIEMLLFLLSLNINTTEMFNIHSNYRSPTGVLGYCHTHNTIMSELLELHKIVCIGIVGCNIVRIK